MGFPVADHAQHRPHQGFYRDQDGGPAGVHPLQAPGIENVGQHRADDADAQTKQKQDRGACHRRSCVRRLSQGQGAQGPQQEGVGGDGRGIVAPQSEAGEDGVEGVEKAGAQPRQQDPPGQPVAGPENAPHQGAAQHGHPQAEELEPGDLLLEDQGGEEQHEGGRGIEQHHRHGGLALHRGIEIQGIEQHHADDPGADEHPQIPQPDAELGRVPKGHQGKEAHSRGDHADQGDLQGAEARGGKGADEKADDAPGNACTQHRQGRFRTVHGHTSLNGKASPRRRRGDVGQLREKLSFTRPPGSPWGRPWRRCRRRCTWREAGRERSARSGRRGTLPRICRSVRRASC